MNSPLGEHIEEKIEELRGVIREANGMLKDLHAATKEARSIRRDVRSDLETRFDELAGEIIREGLEEYKKTLEQAQVDAVNRIFKKFEGLTDMIMGEDKESKRKGDLTTTQVLQAYKARNEK